MKNLISVLLRFEAKLLISVVIVFILLKWMKIIP
jgi:hypothetical protein